MYCIGFRFKTRENNLIQLLVRTHIPRKYALIAYLNAGPGGDLTRPFYRIFRTVLDYPLTWSVLHWLSLQNKRKQPYSTTCPYPQLAKVRPSRVPKGGPRGRPNAGILPDSQFSTGLPSHLECIALAFASKQEKTTLFDYLSVLYFIGPDCLSKIPNK